MRKLIEGEPSGIKCDHPGCGWRDDDAQISDYKNYLNAPCPKCESEGRYSNLLTEADMKLTRRIMRTIGVINFLFSWTTLFLKENRKQMSFDMNGTGKAKVVISDPIQ